MSKRRRQPQPPDSHPRQPDAEGNPGARPPAGSEDAIREVEAHALRAAAERADAAEARADEVEERLKRALAEFRNETQRIARQADERRKYAVQGLVGELLPVFDALHSAREGLAAAGEGPALDAVRQGLDLVEKDLLKVLGRHGVERIEASGAFDPALHEAVFVVDDPDREPSTVAQVLRPGFTLHGRVVRPAHVSVTRAAENRAEAAADADDAAQDED
jgi:molecular chaperone GrpE